MQIGFGYRPQGKEYRLKGLVTPVVTPGFLPTNAFVGFFAVRITEGFNFGQPARPDQNTGQSAWLNI